MIQQGQGSSQERLAALEAAVSRSVELLDAGRAKEARAELARVLSPAPDAGPEGLPEELSDGELDRAFEAAAPEIENMLDADELAQRAIRQADRALAGAMAPDDVGEAFATEAMADVLERQGDHQGASRIRAGLGSQPGQRLSRQEIVATLQGWLDNLGGARR